MGTVQRLIITRLDKIPYRKLYLFFIALLIISIPLSKFTTSISCLSLMAIWFLERDFSTKFKNIWQRKESLLFLLVLLMHLIGVLYSTNSAYAWNDIRIKIPLLLIILFVSYPKLSVKQFNTFLVLYVSAIFVGTLISSYLYYFQGITDTRHITFVSHIRFGVNVCFSVFILFYFIVFEKSISSIQKIIFGMAILWFVFYLLLLRSSTGLICLGFCVLASLVYFGIRTKSKKLKLFYLMMAAVIPTLGYVVLQKIYTHYTTPEVIDIQHLDSKTANGNAYTFDTLNFPVENGKYVGIYISNEELKTSWEKRSSIPFMGKDKSGQEIRFTLIRFLTSKSYRKDAIGVSALTQEEIAGIEHGFATENQLKHPGIHSLIEEFIWGYQKYKNTGNANGSSMMQRYEYAKVALQLIKKYWLYGTGTGDVQGAFDRYYKETNSSLLPELQLRAHNQFLTIFVTFGVIGFALFIFTLIYPAYINKKFNQYLFLMFFIICILSMLTDDLLETQAGISFFAFFTAFLIYAAPDKTLNFQPKEKYPSN